MSRFRPIVIVLTLLIGSAAPGGRAAIPGADDPKAYTQHDLLRARLDFNRRTLAGAYKEVGDRNFKWDDEALKFLDAMAVYFTYPPAEPLYQTVPMPSMDEYVKLAAATADAGCTDPLVQYCRGAVLLDRGDPADRDAAARLVERAVRPLKARKYPAYRIRSAIARVHAVWNSYLSYEPSNWEAILATADAPDADVRHALLAIEPFYNELARPRQLELCKALSERPTANPWITHLLYGKYEISAAWDARGTGLAFTVTDDGWRGMYEHLTLARDHLVKAYELHPDYPEPADEMITVAMGAGDRLKTTTREWFDKAARAQFDYYPAYNHYIYTLLPRWSGSYPEIYQFGIECLQTGRFDTYVPYKLWYAVEKINADTDARDFAVLKVPEVQVALWQMLTTMGEKAGGNERRDTYPSMLVGIKWRLGDYAAAARLLDKLGDRFDPGGGFRPFPTWPVLAVSEIRAMTSPEAAALERAAASARAAGDRDAAITAYDGVAARLGPDHPGARFVATRAKALKLEREFAAGGWVNLAPDASFTPWAPMAGRWDRDKDGGVVAESDVNGHAAFVCEADFGEAFELRARLHLTDPKRPSIPVLLVHWGAYDWYHSAGIITGASAIHVRSSGPGVRQAFDYKGDELVTVRVQGGTMTVRVNDKPVVENLPATNPPPGYPNYVGLGINGVSPGLTARFTDVQIRKLDAPARAPDAP